MDTSVHVPSRLLSLEPGHFCFYSFSNPFTGTWIIPSCSFWPPVTGTWILLLLFFLAFCHQNLDTSAPVPSGFQSLEPGYFYSCSFWPPVIRTCILLLLFLLASCHQNLDTSAPVSSGHMSMEPGYFCSCSFWPRPCHQNLDTSAPISSGHMSMEPGYFCSCSFWLPVTRTWILLLLYLLATCQWNLDTSAPVPSVPCHWNLKTLADKISGFFHVRFASSFSHPIHHRSEASEVFFFQYILLFRLTEMTDLIVVVSFSIFNVIPVCSSELAICALLSI